MAANVIWEPQEKQAQFLKRREYECLYGGAAGGGKSEASVMLPMYWVHIPHFRALILRKTYPQLTELIDKSRMYYPRLFPEAKYNSTMHRWMFPSGATVAFGSMHNASDVESYRGRQFDLIIFDELTHFTWAEYSFMFSRNRPSGPGTFVGIRATTNPGGIGHGWVKERFITCAPPMTPVREEFSIRTPEGREEKRTRSRIFIPATVFDNNKLLENDRDYLANLSMLPSAQKNAQLYGSWDSFDGQVFSEWVNDPNHYEDRVYTHVIAPFRIPKSWRIWRGFDFGYARPYSVGWYAADEDGRLFRIAELYGTNGVPNEGTRESPDRIAANIALIERENEYLRGREITGVADPSIFDESRGESVAVMMARHPNYIYFHPGDNTRLPGKMQYHYRFKFREDGRPMLQVFSTCRHFIRTIPALTYDTKMVEDINSAQEDHIYDECRYVLMENPISPAKQSEMHMNLDDPLDLMDRKARFYRV
ncbi:MAG: phage terminase large subunit [Clostridia bacterium]|nr:phage terminase large subunit [Clostridia bacterium]